MSIERAVDNDLAIFIRINALGVVFTIIIVVFVISIGFYGLATQDFEFVMTGPQAPAGSKVARLPMFAPAYSFLMGTLGPGFYLHNISLPIYRNSKNPENAVRDMFLGFATVAASYMICGTLGAIGFSNRELFAAHFETHTTLG